LGWQPKVCFSVTFLQRPAGRCRPDQVRWRRRWDPNIDDGEAVIIGTVRAVRNLLDASWPSCRILTVHIQGAMEPAEAGHAAADQIRMARDVATMFDEPATWHSLGCGIPAAHRDGSAWHSRLKSSNLCLIPRHYVSRIQSLC
jgi:hypothetical protein